MDSLIPSLSLPFIFLCPPLLLPPLTAQCPQSTPAYCWLLLCSPTPLLYSSLPPPLAPAQPGSSSRTARARSREPVRPSLHCLQPPPHRAFKSAAAPPAEAAAPVLALLEAAQRWSPPCLPPCSWALSFTSAAVLPLWAFFYGPEQRLTASGPN